MTFDKADLEVSRFDAAEHLDSPEAQAEYLAAALETGDAAYIKQALFDTCPCARNERIGQRCRRHSPRAVQGLSENGDPRLSTLLGVIKSLGVRLSIQPGS